MDLRLLVILFLCYCQQGWTDGLALLQEDVISEDENVSVIPFMSPMATSSPPIDVVSSRVSHTEEFTPDGFVTSSSTAENAESSSEEDLDELCGPLNSKELRQAIGNGIMKFGLELLENLKADAKQSNIIISPLSVSLALSQLALGARNDTEELLLQRLHVDTVPCYHKALKSLLHHVRKNALQIASRIYLADGFKPNQEFIEESLKIYDSKPAALTDLEEINEWVEKSTNGHVTDFLSSLPPNLIMMLINAVHYKGEWLRRFDPHFTSSEPFYVDEKHIVNVDMMLGPKYPLSLFNHNELDAQIARFPFKGNVSLIIVMPTIGSVDISAIAAKLNISDLYNHLPRERSMQVKLPKFKLDFTQELEEVLTNMGLGELFSSPNLGGISAGPLLVSSVQHKSSIEINEEGAEAAAATSVAISRSNPSFTVNQPFFLALIEDSTKTPLFLGIISNPNPSGTAVTVGSSLLEKGEFPSTKHFDKPPK
ncbi:serpin peptidase inhibitor, clade F (alpha-2 antiplasmin, pigment epithelium derived factor), member 2b isoform X1 [Ictalurus punctatus]|uniref:Serpin peptidase inhibitor, clade F (Alpha-2 antiplasmin, pigment epithelium derived factor), member 2b isoform X1 n=1 Tax=Ictalurus punctatus TaxID=7998 RepID=A0A2D0SUS3_ICTPU|nr:serpin peptidase inhibitor, clade F (alpha-2 antiplasmin, pigment epithelium derived factor), member 2b isoform X1 [Ictalurus punctatus]